MRKTTAPKEATPESIRIEESTPVFAQSVQAVAEEA